MASSSVIQARPDSGFAVRGSVRTLLRLEAFAVASLTIAAYAHIGGKWWLFAVLWLVPDLSMLGYRINACWGARSYNAAHTYVLPAVLAGVAYALHADALVPIAIIWTNHIAVDRLLGYGLKYGNAFGWTHLGILGKPKNPTP